MIGVVPFLILPKIWGGDNEKLVGEALKPIRDKIVLATKFKVDKTEQTSTREGLLKKFSPM